MQGDGPPQLGPGTHDALRMVEHHLGAVVVEGDRENVSGRLGAEKSPEPYHCPCVRLPIATGNADAGEPISEPTRYPLTSLPEGVALPGIERDAEVLGEGEKRIEEGRIHASILGGGLGGSLLGKLGTNG